MIDGQTIEDGAGDQSTQEVSFNSLYLSVRDEASSDLYEKLSEVYFGFDEVQVGGKQAQKVLELQSLPPVLQIQLEVGLFWYMRCFQTISAFNWV